VISAIIVHGGLAKVPPEKSDGYRQGCLAAVRAGWELLSKGGSVLDAAEAAVRLLEDDSLFNAGRGASLNADGEVELDAAIMDGATLRAGAVAAIRGVRHPISVARKLMESGKTVMLVADGARRFALEQNVELCESDWLITDEQKQEWANASRAVQGSSKDTVGCVALDSDGRIAAATSTGGLLRKLPGRVGDSPLIGCGLYADSLGGTSLTGDGESIIRMALASRILALLHTGVHPDSAADAAIQQFGEKVPGEAGCIVLDSRGRFGFAHRSQNMAYAYLNSEMPAALAFTRKEAPLA